MSDSTSLLGNRQNSWFSKNRFVPNTFNRFICSRALFIGGIIFVVVVLSLTIGLAVGLRKGHSNTPSSETFETLFTDTINGYQIRDFIEEYSNVSHIAGSTSDYQQALETKSKLESWGFEARIHEIPTLLTYPTSRLVEITYPEDKKYVCSMKELEIPQDPTSGKPAIDTFNGYSAPGDVTAQLVYANYGLEEDFQALEAMNISVAGKIVIVRYGINFRGNKARSAQNRGAVGVLIYFEPDAPNPESIYPNGPWRTNTTVQRGSINFGNGDPLTPGWPSTFDGPRLTVEQAKNASEVYNPLPLIPVQPLSWGDAEPLLAALGGANIPSKDWQGNFNFTYHVGPGPVEVHMKLEVNYTVTSVWNVLAIMEGTEEPDRQVILGCHRDAWTFGATDPISGHSILLEIARTFGVLKNNGWAPRRTIVIASWDAEEYSLIGSVEFVETYYNTLQDRAVAYLNLDTAITGGDIFHLGASWSFRTLLEEITAKVPIGSKTVSDIWDKTIGIPGGGSDFVGFIQHAGIAVLNPSIAATDSQYDAVYHSNYDSFYWMSHFGDPNWEYHPALAKVVGLIAMRLACSQIIPLDLSTYAASIEDNIEIIKQKVPTLPLTSLVNSSKNLLAATSTFMTEISQTNNNSYAQVRSINDRIMFFERTFLTDDPELASGDPWIKHVVYASSDDDWYAGVAFTALGQAINNQDWDKVEYLAGRIALILQGSASTLTPKPFGF